MIANGRSFWSKICQKERAENEKGPIGCSMIWNGMLERLG